MPVRDSAVQYLDVLAHRVAELDVRVAPRLGDQFDMHAGP